jgi:hypothetical protein
VAVQGFAPPRAWVPLRARALGHGEILTEATAKTLLRAAGVPVPAGVVADTLAQAAVAARALTPPLALKGLGHAHKTEAGAVRLNLTTLDGQAEMREVTGYLVEEMQTGAVAEVLVGLRRDPVYGVSLTLGIGGVLAELLADTVTLVLPVTPDQVQAALRRLRLFAVLDGYRGRPRADLVGLGDVIARLCAMMEDDSFDEIEVNPVLVMAEGAVAVDALIRRG